MLRVDEVDDEVVVVAVAVDTVVLVIVLLLVVVDCVTLVAVLEVLVALDVDVTLDAVSVDRVEVLVSRQFSSRVRCVKPTVTGVWTMWRGSIDAVS